MTKAKKPKVDLLSGASANGKIESFQRDRADFIRLRILTQIQEHGIHGPHTLRHTFATNYIKEGGDIETLSRILRHSNIKSTQRYVHLQMADIVRAHIKVG
jgi:site-specific recombinase XerD